MPKPLEDIQNRDDIERLVRTFYQRAFADELLGRIFTEVAQMDLEAHLPTMCDFWETVLFRAGSYRGNAFRPHARINSLEPLTWVHFEQWLSIWASTVNDLFDGSTADLAKQQAAQIATAIERRLERTEDLETIAIQQRRVNGP
jgi:hemoglobin